MKNMYGDGTELNHEEKHDDEDDRRRPSPGTNYQNMMNWEDELLIGAAEDLLNVDDKCMSYEDFPPLPDFPCISSSSSSSKSPYSAPPSTSFMNQHQHHTSVTSSESSSASWEVDNSDHKEQGYHGKNLLSTADSIQIQQDELNRLDSGDCMDVMEGFGEMGLFDTDDIWDPSCFFPCEEKEKGLGKEDEKCLVDGENDDNEDKNNKPSENLALVFLEWLKSNKETISAEDLRSIKLKRSTIECAAKGLGGGTQGMEQLFKLILEWVENNHLQRKRLQEGGQASSFPPPYSSHQNHNPNSHEFSSFTPESNFVPTVNPWNASPSAVVPPSVFVSNPMASGHGVYPPPVPMHGFINGDPSMFATHFSQSPYLSSAFHASYHLQNRSHHQPPPQPHHYSLSSHPYGASYHHQDPHVHHLQPPPPPSRYVSNYHQNQYQPCHQMFQGTDGSLIRLGSSSTKEARMKRMSRQRKIFSHHQRHA